MIWDFVGKGTNCTFDELSDVVTCYERGKLQSVDRKWWNPYERIWNYEISHKNFLLFLLNLLFFMYIMGWAVLLIIKYLVTSAPVGLNESDVTN